MQYRHNVTLKRKILVQMHIQLYSCLWLLCGNYRKYTWCKCTATGLLDANLP